MVCIMNLDTNCVLNRRDGFSRQSSMSSFLSELFDYHGFSFPNGDGEVEIHIVDDNAKSKQDKCASIRLVTLRHSRSEKQVNRWGHNDFKYIPRVESDHSLAQPSILRTKQFSTKAENTIRATASDTMLLKMPTRKISPRLVKPGLSSSSNTKNANWDKSDLINFSNKRCKSLLSNDILVGGNNRKLSSKLSSGRSLNSLKNKATLLGLHVS